MKKLYIPVILGTAREGRMSEKVADFVRGEAAGREEIETELLDVRDFRLPATDNTQESETAKKFAEKIEKADGYIIVSPEYNHGYPGELKMMLDMLYQQYARKPLGLVGVSSGGLGGARMVEQLRQVAAEFHMVPIREAVYFSTVEKLFDESGKILDESYSRKISRLLEELVWYAKVLKWGRENVA